MTDASNVVTFGGSATGNITVAIAAGVATFTRSSINATTTVTDLGDKTIQLSAAQTLVIDDEDAGALAGITIEGAGNVTATSLSMAQYEAIDVSGLTGTLTLSLADSANNLSSTSTSYASTSINVSVTNAASVSQLDSIDETWGTVTPTTIHDTLDAITDSSYESAAVNLIVDSTSMSIAQLSDLDANWGTVTSLQVQDVAGNLDEASDSIYESTAANVNVSGSASLAQLHAIDDLWGTVTATSAVDSAANFLSNTGSVFATNSVNASVTTAATIAQLTTIDSHWGTVTASTVEGSAASLAAASASSYTGGAVNATVTDTATIAQLEVIDTAWGTVSFTTITDTAAHLITATASAFTGASVNVTVSGSASISQLNSIDASWGTVTPTYVTDSAANLDEASDSIFESSGINVTVSGSASLAQLAQIDDLWGELEYTSISDTAALLVANDNGYVSGGVNVTVTTAATLTQLADIDALTTGTVTATSITGTAAAVAGSAYLTGSVAITLDAGAATAANLVTINNGTTGSINASAITSISGSAADVLAVYNATDDFTGLGNEILTVSGATSAADLESILTKTTGTVNISLTNTYTTGSSFTVAAGDVINIDPADTAASLNVDAEAAAADVDAAGEWHFNAGTGLFTWYDSASAATDSMTLTGITAVEVGANTVTIPAGELSVSDSGGGTWTISGGTGDITLTKPESDLIFNAGGNDVVVPSAGVTGLAIPSGRVLVSTAAILDTFTSLTGNVRVSNVGDIAAATMNSLDTKTSGTVTVNDVTSVSGALAVTLTAYNSDGIEGLGDEDVTLSDTTLDAGSLNSLDGLTSGDINVSAATTLSGFAAALNTALGSAGITGISSSVAINIVNPATFNTAATVLSGIGETTTGTVTVTNAAAITGTRAELEAALITAGSRVVLGAASTATVSDAVTAAQGAAIAGAANLTATFSGGISDALASLASSGSVTANLTTVVTEDSDVAITINDAATLNAAAANLAAVGGATTGTVTVTNAAAITGTQAEVTAALVTGATAVVLGAASTATVSDAVTAEQGAAIAGVTNLTAAFSGGVSDIMANLVVDADLTSIVGDDADVNITITGVGTIDGDGRADVAAIDAVTTGTLTINGTTEVDTLDFTGYDAGDLIINGLGGADVIVGGDGNDTITGGAGGDKITVGTGTDRIVVAASDLTVSGAAGAAAMAAAADVYIGMTNSDGSGDTLDLDIAGFGGGDLANLTVVSVDFNSLGEDGLANTAGGTVLINSNPFGNAGQNAITAGVIDTDYIQNILTWITGVGRADGDSISDLYLVFADDGANTGADGDGATDLLIFKVDHSAANADTYQVGEVFLVGILQDFGASMSNGFIV